MNVNNEGVVLFHTSSTSSFIIGVDVVETFAYLKEDVLNAMLLPCPNWIAAEERVFIRKSSSKSIRRVSNLNAEEFKNIVNTGEPVVVTDGMRDWPGLGELNCQSIIYNYPDAKYFDWQAQENISLRNINKRNKFEGLECMAGYMNLQTPENLKYMQELMNNVRAPYFLFKDVYTAEPHINSSHPNLNIFIGTENTGVSPHLDETCDTFISAQFSGVKNWSLSWPISEEGELKWSKPIVFTLYPGELLFWYVGMRHHTEVVKGCSLSFSFQITTPAPRDYFHKLSKTVNSGSDADKDKLFKQTRASNANYLDTCNVIEKDGKSFIIARVLDEK
ncbi:uncharacterized protein [Antedon mediterranea]|uniref:uncharacterized protein isoform X2 n=1 Tax=Antedon mediterranea TaxID=105859 RepID=UPI003AF92AA5